MPNIDAEGGSSGSEGAGSLIEAEIEASEAALLKEGAKYQSLVNKDFSQRYLLRWIAVGTGIAIITIMLGIVAHAMHSLLPWRIQTYSSSVIVALFVTPIISITTITIALFIGAFRRFKDDDLDKIDVTNTVGKATTAFKNMTG